MPPPLSEMPDSCDVAVVGGGPAGAAAARMLAGWGHRVLVLTRAPRHTLAESLPPSVRRLLSELGVQEAVDRAPFYASRGNTVWWGSAGPRSEPFPDGSTGYQVERPALDHLLLEAAESAGATVWRETAVGEVEAAGDEPTVAYARGDAKGALSARCVLDCSGRAGVLARRGLRRPEPGINTLALYAVWSRETWDLPDETHTLVESYDGGWGWSIPVSRTVRYVTVMVDPETSGLARAGGASRQQLYDAELKRTTRFRRLIEGARQLAAPRGLAASPYSSERFAGPGWLLVGDAASFIDPLSSFGVKKALASAWLAAVVARTALDDAALAGAAFDLFERREGEAYAALSRQAASLFAEGAATHLHAFWDARAGPAGDTGPSLPGEPDVAALRTDPEVLGALEHLKRAPAIALRPAAPVRLAPKPVVRDHRIRLEDHVHSAWSPQGLRYLRGVNLPRVLTLAPTVTQVPDLYDAYNRAKPWATLPDFLGVLSVLLAKGVLTLDETCH